MHETLFREHVAVAIGRRTENERWSIAVPSRDVLKVPAVEGGMGDNARDRGPPREITRMYIFSM
jgi:hypothetical protein